MPALVRPHPSARSRDRGRPARRPARCATVVGAATAAVLALAPAASAHVRVSSPDAAPGGFGKLVFRVPTESAKASTTKLTVTLPSRTPFAFVSSRPLAGWTIRTSERTLDKPLKAEGFTLTKAVSTVTWTADRSAAVKPGEFQEFELSVGPFPKKADTLTMPATQTYSDGSVVRWDDPTPASGKEPEHPAPVLDLAGAGTTADSASDDQAATAEPTPTVSAARQEAAPAADRQPDVLGRWLGGAGLAAGLAALALVLTRGPGRRRA